MKLDFKLSAIVLGALIVLFGFMVARRHDMNIGAVNKQDEDVARRSRSGIDSSRSQNPVAVIKGEDADIEFYGRVVNEFGKPIDGALVHYQVVKAGSLMPKLGLPNMDRGSVISAEDGGFTISARGMTLSVLHIDKDGFFDPDSKRRAFAYGVYARPHVPDPLAPVEFLLSSAESQISLERRSVEFPRGWDGSNFSVEIATGSRVVFSGWRKRDNEEIRGFEWKLKIEGVGLNLNTVGVGAAPLAAEGGYSPVIEYVQPAVSENWLSGYDGWIDLRTADGKYGRLKISYYANRGKGSRIGIVEVIFNPSGARALK
jgi:hypothetical protein